MVTSHFVAIGVLRLGTVAVGAAARGRRLQGCSRGTVGITQAVADQTRPSDVTRAEEAREARAPADAGRGPTEEEARAADGHRPDPRTADHEEEMLRRGADQEGEGRLP